MKTLTVRLPEELAAQIEAESRKRKVSKSDVIRERLIHPRSRNRGASSLERISDLVGSVDGLPADLSTQKRKYLAGTGYGRKRTG
jgi:Arc/MetJ-type ribon-helix-helix transcriptional regulator